MHETKNADYSKRFWLVIGFVALGMLIIMAVGSISMTSAAGQKNSLISDPTSTASGTAPKGPTDLSSSIDIPF